MGWAQVRQAAREQVHRAFALRGRYFAVLTPGPGVFVLVRVHAKVLVIGELQGGGYPKTLENTEVAVFWSDDVERLGIKVGGLLKLEDGRILRLRVKNAVLDDYTSEYTVTHV